MLTLVFEYVAIWNEWTGEKIVPLYKKNPFIIKLFVTLVLSMILHMGDLPASKVLHGEVPEGPGAVNLEHLMVSQYEKDKSTEKTAGRSAEEKESDSKTETDPEKDDVPSGSEREPLKRFEPSEKIEADQAVDFPWDI